MGLGYLDRYSIFVLPTFGRQRIGIRPLGDRVRLVQSNLLAGLEGRRYDLVICNAPYVAVDAMASLPTEYRHEPARTRGAGKPIFPSFGSMPDRRWLPAPVGTRPCLPRRSAQRVSPPDLEAGRQRRPDRRRC
jgi:hypothetical protein